MKKEVKPIAMRCNKKQFKAIKPKLDKSGIKLYKVNQFNRCIYLVNNFSGNENTITNLTSEYKIDFDRTVYEQWDEKVFLEACGIETEPTYQITKETILKYNMKDEFPDVFEVKLEAGKWYKSTYVNKAGINSKFLVFIIDLKYQKNYGFNFIGEWKKNMFFEIPSNSLIEATHQEVETALKNEAVKWYKVGDYIDCINGVIVDIRGINFNYKDGALYIADSHTKYKVFENGIWATVIPTMSLKEAEEKLNVKIV